ncbi:hypothetical protein K2173_009129 [Erythroxylum novogranatense]|uniref:LAGLIDADG homing endonuclease n=1 Tax=Erythroxylum novogranatense TaxID=1862640 RepID=A0AAV8TJB5_9ROSI|nr:hypothetical protein K2173_009129 [Erythroxylum novogranatense]
MNDGLPKIKPYKPVKEYHMWNCFGIELDEFEGERTGDPFSMLRIIDYLRVSSVNGRDMSRDKDHSIHNSLTKEVRNVAHKFFDLLYEEKLKIKLSVDVGYRFKNMTKGTISMHEAIDVYTRKFHKKIKKEMIERERRRRRCAKKKKKEEEARFGFYGFLRGPPLNPLNFKLVMGEYIRLYIAYLSRNIMCGIALAMDGSTDEFEGISLIRILKEEEEIWELIYVLLPQDIYPTSWGISEFVSRKGGMLKHSIIQNLCLKCLVSIGYRSSNMNARNRITNHKHISIA